ncbi:putative F-box/FBD/LRR-repeat protein [Panicum miliaceum]|uniref:F-box/FBD/LRR-repeat protein n=1 Tax=Panicum miliaceum TaxID=4540 RepID=A0A3L6RA30_PANMI|nr:putative F-box/FBD/LRR-repeat protein [Panicum miliaceum]
MDASGEEGDNFTTYDQSAQERIDGIVPVLVSLLPAPYVPVPEVESDSDDERFSLFSSDSESEASDDGADHDVFTAAPSDGEDRISRLPDTLLADIIHCLPTKDAGRTAALSTHWRRVWAGTPLLVDDAHLLGAGGTSGVPVVRALSRSVAAHPGPVRGVRVTHVSFYAHEYALRRLVADLADKDVQDLILVNRPWPLDMPLPDDIFRCASLDRLYLGVWHFPKTTAAHPPAFPALRELGLFHSIVGNQEFEAMLAHCPKLEVLSLVMSYHNPSRLRLASGSLKIAVDWMSSFDEVAMEDAPSLERLFFQSIGKRRSVKIVGAPSLEVLGVLDLDLHTLEIGGTVIKAGMNVSASNMVPSLKILAVKVQFACNREAKMLPTLLKCFPRLETLHIMSIPSNSPGSVHDLRFWEHRGPCECLE